MNIDKDLLKHDKCDIFTPDNISIIMASYLKKSGNLLEPSVGTGNLLKFINIEKYSNIDIYDIKGKYLNECPNNSNINKYNKDFIEENIITTYENIILNPPYIKIQNLSSDYREMIKKNWTILNKGSIDIYYVFILKCINLLSDTGIMISITPNSYLYNKGSLNLRKYLIENKLIKEIIDFKTKKVFNKVSTYCCITIFSKEEKNYIIYNNDKIYYNNISPNEYNIFINNNDNINTKLLGDICNIKNGIATLRDKIYIHTEKLYDEPCWNIITNSNIDMWCIYPYDDNGKILDEKYFTKNNPLTYKYLCNNKIELSKRDNGKKKYPKWYSYGRTQSLIKSKQTQVIYISTFIDPNNIKYKIDNSKLFISCLCIELKTNEYTLEDIKTILEHNNNFIINNSSKRGGGWLNISSRILKQITIS